MLDDNLSWFEDNNYVYMYIVKNMYVMFVIYVCPDNTTDTHVFQWLLKELSTEKKSNIHPPPRFDATVIEI